MRKSTPIEAQDQTRTARTISAGIGRGSHKSIQRGSSGKQVVPKAAVSAPKAASQSDSKVTGKRHGKEAPEKVRKENASFRDNRSNLGRGVPAQPTID